MKKHFILLCSILIMTWNINAQNQLADFEDGGITPTFTVESGSLSTLGIVDNPDKDGNTTDKVLYGKSDAGAIIASNLKIDFTTGFTVNADTRYLHLLLRTTLPMVEIQVVATDATGTTGFYNISLGGWFDQVIDLNAMGSVNLDGKTVTSVRFIYYTNLAIFRDKDLYIDEIVANNDAAPRTAPISTEVNVTGFETGDYIPYSQTFWYEASNFTTIAVADNPAKAGINTSDKALKIDETGETAGLLRINIPFKKQVLITDANKYLHFSVYSPASEIIFVGYFPDELWIPKSVTPLEWTDVVVDLSAYKGQTISKIELIPSVQASTPPAAYIDNIKLNAVANAEVPPTTTASVLADFEDGGIIPTFTTVGVTASLGIIDNPDNDGNSTNKVLYAKTNNVAGDASIDIVFNNSFIVNSETRYLHLLLKTNIPVYELNVRKKDGTLVGAGLVNLPVGGWFDYVLDLNSVNGADLQGAEIASIRMRLYSHLDDQLNRDFYFDEIIINNTAAQRIADVNGAVLLSGFEAGEYMPPFYTYWYETTQSNSTVAVVDNPVKNDINPSDKVLKIDETNASFPLLRINIPFKKQVLITDANKYLHFYALSSSSPCIFVGYFPDEVWINGALTPNQWTDVVIDLSAYKGKTISKVELVPNVSSGTPPIAYIDDIEMSDRPSGRDIVDSFLDDIDCSVTLPDNDWTFTDTTPSAEVTVKNLTAAEVTFKLICDVYTDIKEAFDKKEVEITLAPGASKKETFTLENAQPGFYRYYIDLAAGTVTRNKFCRVIAYKPDEMPVTVDAKPDFWEFWDAAIAELANTAPNFKVTQRSSTASRIVYDVEMTSIGGYLLKGYYSVPNKAGTFPAIVMSNGYGVTASIPNRNDDYIEFNYNVRGQGISNTSPFSEDWVVAGLSDKATYYYRNAYMDALRAVDFVCSRPEVNQKLLFAEGSSQGGALTYVIGALDRRVKGIVPEIPFMSDFENYYLIKMNTEIDKWPMNLIDAYGNSHSLTHEQVFETLSYFDLKNMMEKVTAPVLMGIGLQDPVCPPHINFAAYNLVTSEKEYHVCAICEHESGSAFNNTIKPQWYKNLIEKLSETGISSIANQGISVSTQGSQIVIEGNTTGLLQMEAYSLDGLKLFSEKASVPYHKTLKKGVYILRITTATGTVCEKILIQ